MWNTVHYTLFKLILKLIWTTHRKAHRLPRMASNILRCDVYSAYSMASLRTVCASALQNVDYD